jgi:hypothetical protein
MAVRIPGKPSDSSFCSLRIRRNHRRVEINNTPMWRSWAKLLPLTYLALFCILVAIYAIYLAMRLRVVHAGNGPDSLFGPIAKVCLISALPFAVLAYSDEAWCSDDAAPVCLAAWITVCV